MKYLLRGFQALLWAGRYIDWQDLMDKFSNFPTTPISPARGGAQVSPSDTTDLSQVSRAIYVGQGGDLTVRLADGDTVLFAAVPGGALLPIRAAAVTASGTSASSIVALW